MLDSDWPQFGGHNRWVGGLGGSSRSPEEAVEAERRKRSGRKHEEMVAKNTSSSPGGTGVCLP